MFVNFLLRWEVSVKHMIIFKGHITFLRCIFESEIGSLEWVKSRTQGPWLSRHFLCKFISYLTSLCYYLLKLFNATRPLLFYQIEPLKNI